MTGIEQAAYLVIDMWKDNTTGVRLCPSSVSLLLFKQVNACGIVEIRGMPEKWYADCAGSDGSVCTLALMLVMVI